MPGFDGTGPGGEGPMTGGRRGYCATPVVDPIAIPYAARGAGIGRRVFGGRGNFAGGRAPGTGGRGRGNMNRFYATGVPGRAADSGIPYNAPLNTEGTGQDLGLEISGLKEKFNGLEKKIKNLTKK